MTDTLIFGYGLELNFSLLHCTIGGPRPVCRGVGYAAGLRQCWDASGHLPNVRPTVGAVVHGALIQLSAAQIQGLQAARLMPLLYQWRKVGVVLHTGRRRQAQMLWCPKGHPPGRPNLYIWQEVVLGALEQGLPDAAIYQLLALRPNDRAAIEKRWSGPLPGLRLMARGGRRAA